MTIKEIAESVGKESRTVRRWTGKASDKMSVIADKMSASSPMSPADFDLEEVILIIETGMGKNAAAVYRQNAAQNEPRTNVQGDEMMPIMLRILENQDRMISVMMNRMDTIESTSPRQLALPEPETHMTLAGYSNIHKMGLTESDKRTAGMILRGICKERGLEIRPVPDARWGRVNSYLISLLDEYYVP